MQRASTLALIGRRSAINSSTPSSVDPSQIWKSYWPLHLSFSTSEFFQQSSGRKERKRRKMAARQRKKQQMKDEARYRRPEQDSRTVRDILFPRSPEYQEFCDRHNQQKPLPKSLAEWKTALSRGWAEYRSTWEGFTASKGFLVSEKGNEELDKKIQEQADNVKENTRRNRRFVEKGSALARIEITKHTGVETMQDLKDYVAGLMRLASDCVREFMQGYRKGRDDETDKMLTKYFQDLQDKANAPKKRKKKQRVLKQ